MNKLENYVTGISGKLYFLYQRKDKTEFLSIIEPHEWTVDTQPYKYKGIFKMDSDGIWNDATKTEYKVEGDWRFWGQ